MLDTPLYLEAPDNEDTEGYCECGEPAFEDGRYPDACYDCNMEADLDAYWERLAEDRADREMFPEDYAVYDEGYYYEY